MRRLLLALASTAAGLAAVLAYKTHGTAVAATVTGTQGGGTSAPAASPGTASGPSLAGSATPAPRGSSGSTAPAPRTSSASTARAAGPRTLTGAVASTPYGPMQVQVTLLDSKITGVRVLQQTDIGTESQQIDATAIPQLTRETLAAQSARIDAVSGASYTSAGYIQSLQSALDKAAATDRSG